MKHKTSKQNYIIIILIILLSCSIGYIVVTKTNQTFLNKKANESTKSENTPKDEQSNLEQTEQEESNKEKAESYDREQEQPKDSNSSIVQKTDVSPIVISFYKNQSTLQVEGAINQIVENKGTCQFFIKWGNNQLIEKKTEAFAEPQSTACTTATFDLAELPDNQELSISLKYSSDRHQGASKNIMKFYKKDIK